MTRLIYPFVLVCEFIIDSRVFQTDRLWQTKQTQTRLSLERSSLVWDCTCPICPFSKNNTMERPLCLNLRVLTANTLGVQKSRTLTLPCGFGPGFFLSSLRALSHGASHTCPVFSTDVGFSSVELRGVVLFLATEFFLSSSFVGDTESLR